MKITFAKSELPKSGVVIVGVLEGRKLTPSAAALDGLLKGGLKRAIKASRFKGRKNQHLTLVAPNPGKFDHVVLLGLGKPADINAMAMRKAGARAYQEVAGTDFTAATVMVDAAAGDATPPVHELAAELAMGARLRSYRFDKYRTKEKKDSKPKLTSMTVCCADEAKARAAYAPMDKIVDGVFLTRDLVSEPANVLYPETLAAEARKLAKLGVKVEVLNQAQMRKLGMGALLGVAQGSVREPRLVVMTWNGKPAQKGKKAEAPLAIVGKGVTFDTGGISLKPSAGMEDMKWDMGGAGVTIGLMKALAGRKARAHVVGVVGLVENMPGANAQRPGDIVTSMSGQTIEVLNTDAEGRLVLADALWYTKERFKPKAIIDLATLTGAIIVCLGNERAGLFSNDDKLAEHLFEAGEATGEPLWRLPLGEEYDRQIDGDASDIKNISSGRGAGSITAAQFLKRFVGDVPWAHLDIAGVTWSKTDGAVAAKGGTGFGVRLLDHLIAKHHE